MDQLNSTTFTPDRERGQHLNFEDRCSIRIFTKLDYSLRKTAEAVGCSASTVLNEIHRGTGKRNGTRGRNPKYSAKRGQQNYQINRSHCHKPHKLDVNSEFVKWVIEQVRTHNWSLGACVGYARKHELFPTDEIPCTKTLYNELWAGNLPLTPFDVPEALTRKRKAYKAHTNKRILGTSIDERPEIASLKIECDHWEIDSVVRHKAGKESVFLTLVEKKTDYYIAIKIHGKILFRFKLLWKYLGKNMVKRISPGYSRLLSLTTGLNLRILKALKNGVFRFTLLIRIHLGKEHRTSATTGCSADMFPREYLLITIPLNRFYGSLMK